MNPKQKAPARVGSSKERVDLEVEVSRYTNSESTLEQGDTPQTSDHSCELERQLDAEVSETRLSSEVISEDVITIREVIAGISDQDHYKKPIQNLRRILSECAGNKKDPRFKAAKLKLDAVVIAGKIDGKIAGAWERGDFKPSGFLQIDMDDVAEPEKVREELRSVDYIISAFISPSGDGVKAIAFIGISRDASDFKTRFEAVRADMASRGFEIDKTCKNANRLMFATWDKDAWTRTTPAIPLKVPKAPPTATPEPLRAEPDSPTASVPESVPASQDLVKLVKKKSRMAKDLYEKGNWEFYKFRSQSDADFSLACSICEVTSQHVQQQALFRDSALYRNERKLECVIKAAKKEVAKNAASLARVDFSSREYEDTGFPTTRCNEIKEATETQDLVLGLLVEAAMSVVYGPSNCGKSFCCLYLAACVAMGIPFFGKEVKQGAVIYFGLEGSVGIRNRIVAMKAGGILSDNAPLHLCFSPLSLLDEGHADLVAKTVARIKQEEQCEVKLIVIDTYTRAMAGGDENSGKDTSAVVATVDAIRAKSTAHVLLIHHCGKDEARGARGHSSLRAATDTEIEITRPDAASPSVVSVKKQRDLPVAEILCFSLMPVHLGIDRRGVPITSCVVQHEERYDLSSRKKGRPKKTPESEILALLPQASTSSWEKVAAEKLKVSSSAFYRAKKCITATGRAVGTANGGWELKLDFR